MALRAQAAVKQTFSSFDDLIENCSTPVLVDFYAAWCGPCHMLKPELQQVGAARTGQLTVVTIDTEKYPNIASRFQIEALPTMILFKNGQPIDRIEGLLQAPQLLARVDYFLAGTANSEA